MIDERALAFPVLLAAAYAAYRLGQRAPGHVPFLVGRVAFLGAILLVWWWVGNALVPLALTSVAAGLVVMTLSMAALVGILGLDVLRALPRLER